MLPWAPLQPSLSLLCPLVHFKSAPSLSLSLPLSLPLSLSLSLSLSLKPFSHMSVFSPHLWIRRLDREGHSHLFTFDARYADISVAQSSVDPGWLRGAGLQGRRVLVCFGLTTDSTEAERADHLKCCCSHASYIPLHPHRSKKDWSMS